MSDSAHQLRRLLAFIPRIADGQEHPIADVAAQLGVDSETIARDLHALSERFGDPPGWIENIAVYIEGDRVSLEAASHFKRPMKLTPAEGRALELGLSVLRAERAASEHSAIEETLSRLRDLVSRADDAGDERAVSLGSQRSMTHVPALRDALRNRKRVRIAYQKGAGAEAEWRMVCPFSFAVEQGTWYLVAHCEKSEGIRIFRTDRIQSIELLGEQFDRPADLDVDRVLAEKTAFVGTAPERLRVRYSPRVARWIAERERVALLPDGGVEMEYPLADADWAVRHVLQYGPDAQVLAPAEVRAEVVRRLRSAAT